MRECGFGQRWPGGAEGMGTLSRARRGWMEADGWGGRGKMDGWNGMDGGIATSGVR
jgi:hypothetical protein